MTNLSEKQRKSMNKGVFAYVDSKGEGHLPLNDESHVRNAMARFNQTKFSSASAKETARRKINAAARKHGIEVSKDDNVAKGGRKTASPKRKTTKRTRRAA